PAGSTKPRLTTKFGYMVMPDIVEAGVESQLRDCAEASRSTFEEIRGKLPWEAQYAVMLAYYMPYLIAMNNREEYHMIELRSGKAGRPQYRSIVLDMHKKVQEVSPNVAR